MRFGLDDKIIEKLIKVFEDNSKVDKAFVFGSRAKGNYRPDSDIDIAVKGYDLSLDDILKMSVAIEEKGINNKIDLIDYNSIKEQALVEHIDRVGIEFYSRWKEYKLEDIAEVQTGPFGSQLHMSDYKTVGTPMITVEHLGENRILHNNLPLVGNDDKQRLIKYELKEGDIVFSRVGSVDRRAYVSNKEDGWMFSGRCLRVRVKNEKANSKFLSYYFGQESFKETIRSIAVGATMPSINTTILREIKITIPNLLEQINIASILSSLDDKIDLLCNQNKTLEQLAETLFRKWFIVETEESWEEIILSDVAIHLKESIKPSENLEKLYKHYSLPSYDEGKEPVIEIGKEILSNKYKVDSNSILVSKLNPRTPRIWMVFGNINTEESICSTEFQVIKPKKDKWLGFIYCFLKSDHVTLQLAGASGGTSGSHQRVNPQDIFNLALLKPNESSLEKFDNVTKDYWKKINYNQTQIRSLIQLRDTLLPKLMSGETRVKH